MRYCRWWSEVISSDTECCLSRGFRWWLHKMWAMISLRNTGIVNFLSSWCVPSYRWTSDINQYVKLTIHSRMLFWFSRHPLRVYLQQTTTPFSHTFRWFWKRPNCTYKLHHRVPRSSLLHKILEYSCCRSWWHKWRWESRRRRYP